MDAARADDDTVAVFANGYWQHRSKAAMDAEWIAGLPRWDAGESSPFAMTPDGAGGYRPDLPSKDDTVHVPLPPMPIPPSPPAGRSPEHAPRGLLTVQMIRQADASGVSGTGTVAQGVLFATGRFVLHWLTPAPAGSINVFESIDQFLAIHVLSHPTNRTVLKFSDGTTLSFPLDTGRLATDLPKVLPICEVCGHEHWSTKLRKHDGADTWVCDDCSGASEGWESLRDREAAEVARIAAEGPHEADVSIVVRHLVCPCCKIATADDRWTAPNDHAPGLQCPECHAEIDATLDAWRDYAVNVAADLPALSALHARVNT